LHNYSKRAKASFLKEDRRQKTEDREQKAQQHCHSRMFHHHCHSRMFLAGIQLFKVSFHATGRSKNFNPQGLRVCHD
jgi:hypothetical protein